MKQSKTDSDRTVHASVPSGEGFLELVRYDRAGKWYVEGTLPGHGCRQPLSIRDAIKTALIWHKRGGSINMGLSGGQRFDRGVEVTFEEMP